MTSYANQKEIEIKRKPVDKEANEHFLIVYTSSIVKASKMINGEVAFKLYLYLLSNKDGYKLSYSPQRFSSLYGVSINSARQALNTLIESGYVVNKEKNKYLFSELPNSTTTLAFEEVEEKRKFKTKDGDSIILTYSNFYTTYKEYYPISKLEELWNNAEVV